MIRTLLMTTLLFGLPALAEVDVKTLYDVSTEGTSTQVKAGEKGTVKIAITTKEGAHVSDEAPLKIELSSKEAKLDKQKLAYTDSLAKKGEGGKAHPDPRFEVGFTAAAKGKATVEAKLTFFICTDKICARQTKALALPVEVQ
ncbi:MAG: hypothetical protein AMXMBFR34_30570 [Myxococcaceae bacterium]